MSDSLDDYWHDDPLPLAGDGRFPAPAVLRALLQTIGVGGSYFALPAECEGDVLADTLVVVPLDACGATVTTATCVTLVCLLDAGHDEHECGWAAALRAGYVL